MQGNVKITDGQKSITLGKLVAKKSAKGNTYYLLELSQNLKIYVWPDENQQKIGGEQDGNKK